MDAREVLIRCQRKAGGVRVEWAEERLGNGLAHYLPVGDRSGMVCYRTAAGSAVIYAAAGDMAELLGALPAVIDWYRAQGDRRLEVYGRKGWLRQLAAFGFRREGDGLVKDLAS